MHLGVTMFVTDYTIRVDDLAREAEARGFESLFVTEHTNIPLSRRTPFPSGGELPQHYKHTLDPLVALTAAAAVTTRLRVGTGVLLVPQHDPIVCAKAIASLDLLSNGRFEFGIGAGWNADEMENHGTAYATRFKVMRERVLAMREIWTKEEASFHGQFVSFDPIWSWPKPVQKPHPPILLGGESEHSFRRIVEFCDGWLPRGRIGIDAIIKGRADLDRMAEKAGRDPRTISATVYAAEPDAGALARYRAARIERGLFALPSKGRDETLALLDKLAPLLRSEAAR
jgi:probable F420-dependent oxidoreductase